MTSVTEQNIYLDHADWTKNTVVKSAATRVHGLFVARDIEAGAMVMCQKALCLPNLYHGEEASEIDYVQCEHHFPNSKTSTGSSVSYNSPKVV